MKNVTTTLLALTFCLLITLTLIPVPTHSTVTPQDVTTVKVTPPERIVQVESFFDICVTVTDVYELFIFDITLTYDTTKMDAQTVTVLPPFGTPPWIIIMQQIDDTAGTVHVVCQAPEPSQAYSGTSDMFQITYVCTAPGENSPLHLASILMDHTGAPIPHQTADGTVTQNQPAQPPINVTYRLLAIEHYYSNALSYNFECVGSMDYAMKSAQYLITTLRGYPNWQNLTTPLAGYKYTAYIHLLSNHSSATSLSYYRGPPTNSNVVNEIQNFLAVTDSPWENNSLTIRILYYVGHSGIATPALVQSQTGFFLALGDRGSHPANSSDPSNPSSYQELWDYQLNQTLCTGDLATNNCTLIILDSCRSEAAIQMLQCQGRVILTACKTAELANGWVSNPANWPPGTRDRWSFFTGQNAANAFFGNGTAVSGPLGIIGAITLGCDVNNDGWADSKEIFNIANVTTVSYSKGEAKQQTPQHKYGVMNGKIPLVQYNNKTAFPYNGRPGWETKANLTWPGFHNGADRTGKTFGAGPSLGTPLWTQNGIGINASVVISEYEAIVAATNGSVYGLDLATGSMNWKINLESTILATPYVDKGVIYVATIGGGGGGGGVGGMLCAIDEATGTILWQYQTPPETGYYASPVVADGYVFVATTSELGAPCEVSARNQTTGELLWSRIVETPAKSSPAVKEGLLYVATTAKGGEYARLHAFSGLTGTKVWNYSFGLSDVISTPAVAGGKVFIGCMGGGMAPPGLYAFSHLSGTLLWEYLTPAPVCSSPAVDEANDRIIFGCEDGATIALNMTGHLKWQRATGGAGGSVKMEATALSGTGYVSAQGADTTGGMLQAITYYVYWLNEITGDLLWQYALDGPPTPPAIADDYLFIGTSGSSLYCFGSPWPEHDVAVKQVFPHGTTFPQGSAVTVEYTIKNEGNVAEYITVTIGYRNSTTPPFGDITAFYEDNFILNAGAEITKYCVMFTIALPLGIYEVYGVAHAVNGENDVADNILVDGLVTIEPLNMGGGGGTSHALMR